MRDEMESGNATTTITITDSEATGSQFNRVSSSKLLHAQTAKLLIRLKDQTSEEADCKDMYVFDKIGRRIDL